MKQDQPSVPETPEQLEARRQAAYAAIGRYFVEFSRLTFHMRTLMERRLGRPGDSGTVMQLVFGDATAATLAHTFFALCKELGNLGPDEEKIRLRLYDEVVQKAIPERNDFAHGDWWVGAIVIGPDVDPHAPGYTRAKTNKARSTHTVQTPLDELAEKAAAISALRDVVIEFGEVCFGAHVLMTSDPALRVSDLFVLRSKQVVREGPKSSAAVHGVPPEVWTLRP